MLTYCCLSISRPFYSCTVRQIKMSEGDDGLRKNRSSALASLSNFIDEHLQTIRVCIFVVLHVVTIVVLLSLLILSNTSNAGFEKTISYYKTIMYTLVGFLIKDNGPRDVYTFAYDLSYLLSTVHNPWLTGYLSFCFHW